MTQDADRDSRETNAKPVGTAAEKAAPSTAPDRGKKQREDEDDSSHSEAVRQLEKEKTIAEKTEAGTVPNITEREAERGDAESELKEAVHELEEEKGDWSKGR
jgi:hypothetical protein